MSKYKLLVEIDQAKQQIKRLDALIDSLRTQASDAYAARETFLLQLDAARQQLELLEVQ
jgi:hypothetical protein